MVPSWGTLRRSWDDLGTLGTTRQDTVRSRLGFYWFLVDLGDPFREVFGNIWTEKHNFFTFVSRLLFLMIWGSESGCLGSENQAFGKEGIAKINFCRNWISNDSRVNFLWFWVALGPIFMSFVGLETGLKFDEFSGWFWGHPRSCDPSGFTVTWLVPGP